jgi:hypothetical protein
VTNNTLAYFEIILITNVRSFIEQAAGFPGKENWTFRKRKKRESWLISNDVVAWKQYYFLRHNDIWSKVNWLNVIWQNVRQTDFRLNDVISFLWQTLMLKCCNHRHKTRVQMPAKMFPQLKLLCWLFMGPLLVLTQSKEIVFWSHFVFFTIKAGIWQYYS